MKIIKQLVQASREKPDSFAIERHLWTHKPTNTKIWIANGLYFCTFYEGLPPAIGFLNRLRLWRAYQRWSREFLSLQELPL